MPTRTVVLGASGHAKVLAELLALSPDYEPIGFVDSAEDENPRVGLPVLGADTDLAEICRSERIGALLVGIGDNFQRDSTVSRIDADLPRIPWAKSVHPRACLSRSAQVGDGTAVMANATIGVDTVIDCHAIINTGASVDHDCTLSAFCSIAPGAVLGGGVRVGRRAVVSLGASVIHGVSIGADTVVGAGSVVVEDLPSNVVAVGVPARVVRTRESGDPYL